MKMRKALVIFLISICGLLAVEVSVHAAPGASKESKLKKDSYEKLVAKNLELRGEVDSLIKEQEQLRGIYKVLLEKVKTLQRDSAEALNGKEEAEKAAAEAKAAIKEMKKTLTEKAGAAASAGTKDIAYEKNLKNLKNSLDSLKDKYEKSVAEKGELEKELQSIKENIANREEESKNIANELQAQYAAADTQNRRIDELSVQLRSALEGQGTLTRDLEKARRSLEEKDIEIKEQYEKIVAYEEAQAKEEDFRKSYQAKEDEIESLKETIGKLNETVKILNAEREKNIAENEELRGSLDEAIEMQNEEIKKLEEELAAANMVLKAKESEIESISAIRENLDTMVKELEERVGAGEKIAEKDKLRIGEEAEKVARLKKEIAEIISTLNDGVKESEDLRAAGKLQSANIRELEKSILANKEKVKEEAERLQARQPEEIGAKGKNLEEFKNSPAVVRIRKETDRLSAEKKSKEEELKSLDEEIRKERANEKDIRDKIELLDKAMAESRSAIADAAGEVKSESDKTQSGEDKVKDLEDALDNLLAEESDTQASLQEAADSIVQTEESIAKASAAKPEDAPAGAGSEELKTLEAELEKARDNENILRAKARGIEAKIGGLKEVISTTRDKAKEESAARIASAQDRIKELEDGIAKKGTGKQALEEGIKSLTQRISGLEEKRKRLAADIESKDGMISDLKKIMGRQIIEINSAGQEAKEPEVKEEVPEKKIRNSRAREKAAAGNSGDALLPPELLKKVSKERLDMHYNLGVVYDRNGMYKDAEREYLKCLEIDPHDADVHYNLGILYDDKLNSNQKAANHYKRYLALRPMGENVMQVRGWLTSIELEQRIGKEVR